MNLQRVESNAVALLEAHGFLNVPVDVDSLAYDLGLDVDYQPLEWQVDGVLVLRKGKITIGVNERHHSHRQRFTVAHEIAHYWLHRDDASVFIDSSQEFHRDKKSGEGTDWREVEANSFAAALLMPAESLKNFIIEHSVDLSDESALEDIAEVFDVSAQAMTIRLMNLGLLRSA